MAEILITEFMDEAAVADLQQDFAVVYEPDLCDNPNRIRTLVREARALIVRNRTQVRGKLLAGAEALECVGRLGVGLDNIDLEACRARGVEVFPASGANDLAVAEYVIAAALILLRGSWHATSAVIAGAWPRQELVGQELSGKVMGLIGYGAIARAVGRRAVALGMRCIAYDPFVAAGDTVWGEVGPTSMHEVLATSDVLSLHTPLTADTFHLLDASALAAMRPGAVVINAARGGVVDEAALIAALKGGILGGAALDVFETEPLSAEAGARFSGLDNLLLTPHIAGVTTESNQRVGELVAARVRDHLMRTV